MKTEQLVELSLLESMGLLDQREGRMFKEALQAAPPTIQTQIRAIADQIMKAHSDLVPDMEPPTQLRDRVITAVREQLRTFAIRPPRLRLARLTLQGFKSFADRTEFTFDQPITGIVGPNGSGKSNVVDAVKWVLGERSSKSLRGKEMLDVIFAGSSGRKPSGLASVSLAFENPVVNPEAELVELDVARHGDEDDDAQHAQTTPVTQRRRILPIDADVVEVERRLYRDGRSEYVINGKKARLRDIRDFFLDTGIGADAYSIIEQGKVDAMLLASPQERRTIFEEAAGIAKYKQRRIEAQRKLEQAQANLALTREQLESTERRLCLVRGQATKARRFKELDAEFNALRLAVAFNMYDDLRQRLDGLTSRLKDLDEQRHAAKDAVQLAEAAKKEAELARDEAMNAHKQVEERLLAAEHTHNSAMRRRQLIARAIEDARRHADIDNRRIVQARQLHETLKRTIERLPAESPERASLNAAREIAKSQCFHLHQDTEWNLKRLAEHERDITEATVQIEEAAAAIAGLRTALADSPNNTHATLQVNAERHTAAAHQRLAALEKEWDSLEYSRRELEYQCKALEERTREELSVDLEHAFPGYRQMMSGGNIDRPHHPEAVSRIEMLRHEVRDLGNVNLHAIEEEEQVEQGYEALVRQVRDLGTAASILRELTMRLDQASKEQFATVFGAVQEHFGGQDGLFRRLFGGGRAEIRLMPLVKEIGGERTVTDEVDLLESDIEIIAKPPGKEPRPIDQLSGGEKRLAALALLMSFFRSRPPCFCVLDEVDEGLDEGNLSRYCATLRDLADSAQLVVITHNKKTMQTADRLYGVTMSERGVSKCVSVRLDSSPPETNWSPDNPPNTVAKGDVPPPFPQLSEDWVRQVQEGRAQSWGVLLAHVVEADEHSVVPLGAVCHLQVGVITRERSGDLDGLEVTAYCDAVMLPMGYTREFRREGQVWWGSIAFRTLRTGMFELSIETYQHGHLLSCSGMAIEIVDLEHAAVPEAMVI